jgi:hypothetical protein
MEAPQEHKTLDISLVMIKGMAKGGEMCYKINPSFQ